MSLIFKIAITLGALVFWFLTQRWLGKREPHAQGQIKDLILDRTASVNKYLNYNPKVSNFLLISSSLFIDGLGIFIIIKSVFGPDFKPLISLIVVFLLRQLNQAVTALPTPQGIIWRDPKVPSLFVTYGVSTDLFFSGHTALATLGTLELLKLEILPLSIFAVIILIYEIAVVLLLRAHWTMDVFTGVITALCVFEFVSKISL